MKRSLSMFASQPGAPHPFQSPAAASMVTPFVPSPESDRVSSCYGRCSPETGKVACKRSSVHRCCWFVELLPWSSEFRHCSSRNHRRSLQPRSKPSSLHKRRREFVVFLYCRQNFYYCWSRGKTRRKMKREMYFIII
nr:hypothetical protein Iba_chr10eCG14360 [Ipomoea batatas]